MITVYSFIFIHIVISSLVKFSFGVTLWRRVVDFIFSVIIDQKRNYISSVLGVCDNFSYILRHR